MRPKFFLPAGMILALAVLVAAACGGDDTPSATTGAGGTAGTGATSAPKGATLVVAAKAMPLGIDGHYISGNEPTWISIPTCYEMAQMYARVPYPLKDPPEGKGANYLDFTKIEPWFLQSWQLSTDGKSATIKIRPGVKSAAGNELPAEDIKWTV